jgi:excisionase family DNA binding protein
MKDGLFSPADAAEYLTITVKTLRAHVRDGSISYIQTGRGKKRPHYAFARADLDAFAEARRRRQTVSVPCPSIDRKAPPDTSSTSGSTVIGFVERRAQLNAARPSK